MMAQGEMQIASGGEAKCVILTQPRATIVERHSAAELANFLQQITGATFEVRECAGTVPESAIIIGQGPLAQKLFPDVKLETFDGEQLTMRSKGGRLLLAGGRPRGTLYAVYRFLQEQCGVRWWAPWAAHIPRNPNLSIGGLSVDEEPAFELRDPYWFPAFDGDWAARNGANGHQARLGEEHGGKIVYKGFVHTFFGLVPPEEHFDKHPEWYSLIDGQRRHPESHKHRSQLCTTNPELRDFLAERVLQWLKESPEANIVSVSQDDTCGDWSGACQCPDCKAIDDREGSQSGTVITLLNYIAGKLGPEFPNVAFDTLAYRYTRKAPKTVKPLPNVIVRLCSIECNFAAPMEDPSNAQFAQDVKDWSKVSGRLYVWDYTTDFAHYVLPYPNWFSLGPNVRFFKQHSVKGLFEQGAYQSHGSEMSEMRAWVLAQLLWNPNQDNSKLIDEFLDGYYGGPAGRLIRQYMDLLHKAAAGSYMGCYTGPDAPYLKFETLSRAERLWQQAEEAAKSDPDLLWRVRQGHLAVRYAFLANWTALRRECLQAKAKWPLPLSRKAVADEWLAAAIGPGPQGWAPMTHVNEGGLTPQAFAAGLAIDPLDPALNPARKLKVEKKYLNLPVKNGAARHWVSLLVDGKVERDFEIELADGDPDWWAFLDLAPFKGKTVTIQVDWLPGDSAAVKAIEQSDTIKGGEDLYREELRPQFHFSPRRGWNNDPNGLVFHKGEYHLFFQHNPYGWNWGNMHWGHAVSPDLVHWEELDDAIRPDELGTIFSGSAVVDEANTTGFAQGAERAIVCIYTAAGGTSRRSARAPFTQCIAYSTDRGRTWTKYEKNPVLPHIAASNRDPKVIWYAPGKKWVLALYLDANDYALFDSPDLKSWRRLCDVKLPGDGECPEFFEIPVAGGTGETRWVFYGGKALYLIGRFDGKTFTPESGPHQFNFGNCFYASQTYNGAPGGRRILVPWGQVNMPGMPFNQMMGLPVELTLRTTEEGLRLFAWPVREIETLRAKKHVWKNAVLKPGENPLAGMCGDLFDITAELAPGKAAEVGLTIRGTPVIYDARTQELVCGDKRAALRLADGRVRLRALVDRVSIDLFGNDGRLYMPMQFQPKADNRALELFSRGGEAKVISLELHELKPAWGRE